MNIVRTYEEICQTLRDHEVTAAYGDIWEDLDVLEKGSYYRAFFSMGQTFLDRQDLPFDIRPAAIYFNNITAKVNACARRVPPLQLIEFNLAVITNLIEKFYHSDSIFGRPEMIRFRDIAHEMEQAPAFLIFQSTCLFFFLHEVGHLVQLYLEKGAIYVELISSNIERYSVADRHTREADADWFGASSLADHFDLSLTQFTAIHGTISQAQFEDLAAIELSSIYIFFVGQSNNVPFYTAKETHPHAAVRLSLSVTSFMGRLKHISKRPYSPARIVELAKIIASAVSKIDGDEIFPNFDALIKAKLPEIGTYVRKLHLDIGSYPYSSAQYVPIPPTDFME